MLDGLVVLEAFDGSLRHYSSFLANNVPFVRYIANYDDLRPGCGTLAICPREVRSERLVDEGTAISLQNVRQSTPAMPGTAAAR